jgi:hypothetical protein
MEDDEKKQHVSDMAEQVAKPRSFPLRVILTVTTGRLLTEGKEEGDNGIGDLYDILGHMTGESPYTHTLGRFAEECKPFLYKWYPELSQAETALSKLDEIIKTIPDCPAKAIKIWLACLTELTECKAEYEIGRIPNEKHIRKDPIGEMAEMRSR